MWQGRKQQSSDHGVDLRAVGAEGGGRGDDRYASHRPATPSSGKGE